MSSSFVSTPAMIEAMAILNLSRFGTELIHLRTRFGLTREDVCRLRSGGVTLVDVRRFEKKNPKLAKQRRRVGFSHLDMVEIARLSPAELQAWGGRRSRRIGLAVCDLSRELTQQITSAKVLPKG